MRVTLRKFLEIVGNDFFDNGLCQLNIEKTDEFEITFFEPLSIIDDNGKSHNIVPTAKELEPFLDYEIVSFNQKVLWGEIESQNLFLREPVKEKELSVAEDAEPSFIDDLMNDKAIFSDIDKYVEYWHNHETGKTLQEFLGLTDEEYEEWGKSSNESVENLIFNARERSIKTDNGAVGKEEFVKE